LSLAQNYAMDYQESIIFNVNKTTYGTTPWGEGYYGSDRLIEVLRKFSDVTRAQSLSLKLENSTVNQGVEILGIYFEVQATGTKLISQNTRAS